MTSQIQALIDRLDAPSFSRRRTVIRQLAEAGDAAIPSLVEQLVTERGDETRVAAAVEALVQSAGDVESLIRPLEQHENPAVVSDAAQILGRRRNSESIDVLVRLMEHENDNVSVAAIEALGHIGGRAAVTHLLAALERDEFFRVFPAIDVLGRTGDPRVVEPLAALLDHPHYALEATRALGRTGQPAAIRPLTAQLFVDNALYVRTAARALEELRRRCCEQYGAATLCDADLIAGLAGRSGLAARIARNLEGAEPAEQGALALVLGAIGGEDALGALLQMLDGDPMAAEAAAEALRAMDPLPIGALDQALTEGSSRARSVLLPRIDQPELEAAVIRALSDADEHVRVAAIRSLARMARTSAAPRVFARLDDESGLVRQAALTALLVLGGPELQREATRGSRSDRVLIRRASLRILGHFGFAGAEETLLAALEDRDPQCRDIALQGLSVFDSKAAVDAVLQRSSAKERETRASAARAMARLDAATVREALWRALQDEDEWVRYYACRSLGVLRDADSRDRVIACLDDPSKLVGIAAIEAIAQIGGSEAVELLARRTDQPDSDVQRAGLVALGMLGSDRARVVIERHLRDPDPATRLLALSALEKTRSPESLSRIIGMLQDEDTRVRNAAFEALADWPGPEAARQLLELLLERPDDDRCVDALARPVAGRLETVLEALFQANETTAPLLTAALARSRSAHAMAALEDVLLRGSDASKKAAAGALIASGGRAEQNFVRDAMTNEKNPEVRRVVNVLLARRA